MAPRCFVVMGVEGSGKSTMARAIATAWGGVFVEGDELHPRENVLKMASGVALDDDDRRPWLHAIGQRMQHVENGGDHAVVACSALARRYRDILREYDPDIFFVFLDGPRELLEERLAKRQHAFMPPSLLESQLNTLEPLAANERGIRVSVTRSPDDIVAALAQELHNT